MKSTIKVELGTENKPVIRMKVYPTDDVRDVLFQQFKEGFQYESNLCYANIDTAFKLSDGLSAIISIEPLPPNSYYICHKEVEEIYHHLQGLSYEGAQVSMLTGSDFIWFENQVTGTISTKLDREQLRILALPTLVHLVSSCFNEVITAETRTEYADNRLPSKHQVDDLVSTSNIYDGQVVGVRFTVGKVYYDILDKLSGEVIRDVDGVDILKCNNDRMKI